MSSVAAGPDPTEQAELLLRDLNTDHGLSQREADRRLVRFGRNELVRRGSRRWPRQLVQQFTHPLALLLAAAAVLAVVAGIVVLAVAIAAVIVLNAALAFVQERQAEAAIEALRDYLPPRATVVRDGREQLVEAALLVPGDIVVLGIVACQVGTAFAARTDHASLRAVGFLSNPLLLWGIAFELAFTAAVVYVPALQSVFGTASLGVDALLFVTPFPLVVWGADELRRLAHRRRAAR